MNADDVRAMAEDDDLLLAAHKALEDELIERRDAGISLMGPANGLVVRYRNATPSDAIRIPTREAVHMALFAIAKRLEEREGRS